VSVRDRWKEIPKGARIAIVAVAILALLIVIGAAAGSGSKKKTPIAIESVGTSVPTTSSTPPAPPVGLRLDTGDYSVTSSHTTLHGSVTKGASVTVEGNEARVHGTHWSKTVALEIGGNNMTVEATLAGRAPATQTISVTRHHTQAELEAKAQARKERERKEREQREVEERKEKEEKEIENATVSQQNALKEAESYLKGQSFSEAGLIDQLSSEAGSGFPHADAVWAVEHLHVDWNEQAVKEAESYLKGQSFSCQGLTDQLSSEAGSQFTLAQAEYAAHQVGLC
jgi:sorbitol-specific phosphotransferase system component IIA